MIEKLRLHHIILLEFPAIGREEQMNGLIAQFISTLQIFVYHPANSRSSFREFNEEGRLIQNRFQVIHNQSALSRFAATIAAFKGD